MNVHLTILQAYRATYKRMLPFAAALAALFTLCAFAQYFFITGQIRATAQTEMETAASRIKQEIAFTNSWDLIGWRHAEFPAGIYYIFTPEGFQIENGGYVPGLITRVAPIDDSAQQEPTTVRTPVGETWRLLRKQISGGFVVLGILDLDDDLKDLNTADKILYSEAAKFGSTLAQATNINPREIPLKVDYAVVADSGDLETATGCIPLRLLNGPILDAVPAGVPVQVGGRPYVLHRKAILGGSGIRSADGQIVLSEPPNVSSNN